ncbi:MAG TPA: YdeI/OmpD-associated family protein [Silvibacterium sp.]|nr:YdeI/OmpD-associated family protein [Silvibacterium sp.]
MAQKKYSFKADLKPAGLGGTFVLFPYDTEKEFGTKGKIPVKASFDGIPYTGSLTKYGYPQHTLHVPKAIREQAGKKTGDTLDVVLWKDTEDRVLEVPPAFAQMMKREGLREFFDSLSYTHRKEYCRWISEAKMEETRARRLEKAVKMMREKVKTPG